MIAPSKLTKKQKKALAFRKGKKGIVNEKSANDVLDMEAHAIPIMEEQVMADLEGNEVELAQLAKKGANSGSITEKKVIVGKGKNKADPVQGVDKKEDGNTKAATAKKRKREGGDEAEDKQWEVGKRKKEKQGDEVDEANREKSEGQEVKQRFILFVGNLKYSTSREAIQAHFSKCDPPPTIRLLTPKRSCEVKTLKSKGCAFLEFTHRNALQQGLKLHQSTLEGRMINVELTAGGGGKSEARLKKVKERNKALLGERTHRLEKEAPNSESLSQKPQRYSATSGIEKLVTTRKTWTVGDGDDNETHRGGKRHTMGLKSRRPKRPWATGVNAIPVG